MDTNTLKSVLEDKAMSAAMAREARTIGIEAREDRRTLIDRMNEQMQLSVARAAGATVQQSETRLNR